jgi:hypothetical protein
MNGRAELAWQNARTSVARRAPDKRNQSRAIVAQIKFTASIAVN